MRVTMARGMLTDCLKHINDGDVLVMETTGKDETAVDENAGHIQAKHSHHHAGQALVASSKCNQRVIAMAANGKLHRIGDDFATDQRSEEHTSELQSLMRISYAVFCLKKKNIQAV